MSKDRARPFSKKHRRYWVPVLGGMIVIGGLNLALGFCAWPGADKVYRTPEPIIPVLPDVYADGGYPKPDAADDAAPAAAADASPTFDASPR